MGRKRGGYHLYRDKDGRNPNWKCRFTKNGLRFHFSTRTANYAEAQRIAAQTYAEAKKRPKPLQNRKLAEVMALYISDQTWESDTLGPVEVRARRLCDYFGSTHEVTKEAIRRYMKTRLLSVSREAVRKERSVLHACWQWASHPDRGLVLPVEFPSIPEGKGKEAIHRPSIKLTAEQVEALLEVAPAETARGYPLKALVAVVWDTGLRKTGCFRLRVPWHFDGRPEIRITSDVDKEGFARVVAIREQTAALLPTEPGRVFPAFAYLKPLREAAAKVLEPYDAENLKLRDIRHAAATDLLQRTGDLQAVQQMLGHKDLQTTVRYLDLHDQRYREAIQKRFSATEVATDFQNDEKRKEGA